MKYRCAEEIDALDQGLQGPADPGAGPDGPLLPQV